MPGHEAPLLAVEVVSETNPHKDYVVAPDKYAASGTRELWLFDPLLAGPTSHSGPYRIHVWRRANLHRLERLFAGEGPAYSPTLGAHLIPVDGGRRLRIAMDPACDRPWLTDEEAERAAKEAERAAKEVERAAKESALARVEELERTRRRP